MKGEMNDNNCNNNKKKKTISHGVLMARNGVYPHSLKLRISSPGKLKLTFLMGVLHYTPNNSTVL